MTATALAALQASPYFRAGHDAGATDLAAGKLPAPSPALARRLARSLYPQGVTR